MNKLKTIVLRLESYNEKIRKEGSLIGAVSSVFLVNNILK